MRALSLPRSVGWAVAATALQLVGQMGLLIVLVRLGSAQVLGEFSLGQALATPVVTLLGMQLRIVKATDAAGRYLDSDYFAVSFLGAVAGLAGSGLLGWGAGYSTLVVAVTLGIALGKGTESIEGVVHGYFQRHGRFDRVAQSRGVRAVLGPLFAGVGFAVTGDALGAALGLAVGGLLTLNFEMNQMKRAYRAWGATDSLLPRRPHRFSAFKSLAFAGLPLGLTSTIASLISVGPRYIIDHFHGTVALGHFATVSYLYVAFSQAAVPIAGVIAPRLADDAHARRKGHFRLMLAGAALGLTVVAMLGWLGAHLFGRQVLDLLFGPGFGEHARVLEWLMVASVASNITAVIRAGLSSLGRFTAQVPLAVVGATAAIAGCLWWIPDHGIIGAAWGLLVGRAAQLLVMAVVLWGAQRVVFGTSAEADPVCNCS